MSRGVARGRPPPHTSSISHSEHRHQSTRLNRVRSLRQPPASSIPAYALAIAATAAALLLRWSLDPWLGSELPFTALYVAVAVSVWYGGWRPSLLAAAAGLLAGAYLFLEPRGTFFLVLPEGYLSIGRFAFTSAILIGLGQAIRVAERRARARRVQEALQDELEREVEERTAALRASEERFRLLVEGSRDHAIFMLDPAGHIVSWNPGAQRIKGYTAEDIIGEHFSRFYPEDVAESGWPDRELEIAAAEGKHEEEGWRIRKDGSRFWASVVITALRDETGELRGFGKVTRDITDRKEAEESARRLAEEEAARRAAERYADMIERQREQLRVTLESIGDAVIATDPDGRVALLNPVAAGLTGWTSEEATGRPLASVFRIVNEKTREPVENPAELVMRRGVVVGLANHTVLIARDGTERPIDDSAAPIRDGDGRLVGVVLVFRDVTERREVERARPEADRRKDQFLATLSHELRNPLAPIQSAAQIMRAKGPADPDLRWAQDVIDRQVKQMARLLEDLLDVSRVSHDKLELRRERVTLAEVVDGALETSRPLIQEKEQRLAVTLPEEPVVLDADPVRLAQVFSNLLNNASKYSEEGAPIRLAAERDGDDVVVSVRDEGIGISDELLPRVFEVFSQGARSSDGPAEGLGIGLSLSRALVELHGGRIEARSEGVGEGTEFVVRLPALAEEAAPREDEAGAVAGAEAAPEEGPGRRVLVVDDSKDSADSLALLLKARGHEVRTAYDGEAAIAAAAEFRPEVMLLDIGMPGLDGFEVCRRIRGAPWGRAVVVLALTGWGGADDRRRTEEAGFDGHLVKPVDPAALSRALVQQAGR